MARRKKTMSDDAMLSRSARQGGFHTFADVHRGPRTGFDGAILRAVFGDDPLDFEKAIEWEMKTQQHRQPGRFLNKIAPGRRPKRNS